MHNNQYKLCSLLKKKKGPLLIHSNLELYILHTYIRLCGTVHLLEFDLKHTQKKKEPMKKTYEPQRKRTKKNPQKKKKKKSNFKKDF